ncbi:MAG: hypothetical protein HS115_20090 [Spirochaetales bacterium]|nr:hypothetical protein [Spirochaetales bacterium]
MLIEGFHLDGVKMRHGKDQNINSGNRQAAPAAVIRDFVAQGKDVRRTWKTLLTRRSEGS